MTQKLIISKETYTMERCSRCILPENYPDIKFDKSRVCHKCYEQEKRYLNRDLIKLEKELLGIFSWAKRKNKRYDCIVPFSGGKDSSYTLHLCRKKYGLKVLAVNFNNGLRTPEALNNIENIIKKTDCAYVCYGPNWQLLKKLYRAFFLKTGQFCFPCDMGIWATIHRVAEEYDVPLIVSGFSAQIESRGPKIYSYNNRLFETITEDIISPHEMKDFIGSTKWEKITKRIKRLSLKRYRRQISLPDYINWDDKVIKDTIYNELGWQKKPDGSSDHIDCLFAPMKNYLVVQKWGFGEKTTKYSAMTRAGQISRTKAMEKALEEETPNATTEIYKKLFTEILEISPNDIENAKNKSHLGYL